MAKTPVEWLRWVRTHCTHAGLTESDADECVSETLLRYHHRRGAYPWDEPAPDVRLLRLLARNVAHEYQRACARRQRIERDYYALQHALMTRATSPEHQAVSNADAERFRDALPTYLQQTLELLEAGYTPAEIAQRLNIRVSTVYTYCRDLKARFVEYFGYDPRISGGCVVNYSGGSQPSLPNHCEEVYDEASADDSGYHGVIVSDCELGSDAPHAGGVERVQRGGGATPSPTMSSDGCGCSQLQMEVSPEKVKEILAQQRSNQLEYEWAQRRRPKPRDEGGVEFGFGVEVPFGGGSGGGSGGSGGRQEQPDCLITAELCEEYEQSENDQKCCERALLIPCSFQKPFYLRKRKRELYTCYTVDAQGRRAVRSRWAYCSKSWRELPVVDCCTQLGCDQCESGVNRLCKKNGNPSATD